MIIYIIGLVVLTITLGLYGEISIQLRWALIMVVFGIFLAITGKRVTAKKADGQWQGGSWTGILIDAGYKMSLSRLQIILWTILALSAFSVIGLDRAIPVIQGRLSELSPPTTNSDAGGYDALNIKFPEELLIALGISTASLAGASVIKSNRRETGSKKQIQLVSDQKNRAREKVTKAQIDILKATEILNGLGVSLTKWKAIKVDEPTFRKAQLEIDRIEKLELPSAQSDLISAQDAYDRASQELTELEEGEKSAIGDIHANDSIAQADWSDLFRGELVSNFQVVDITKVQMFFFTIMIIFTYGTLIWGMLGDGVGLRSSVVELPAFSASLNGLLGISHAGYLVVKQTG